MLQAERISVKHATLTNRGRAMKKVKITSIQMSLPVEEERRSSEKCLVVSFERAAKQIDRCKKESERQAHIREIVEFSKKLCW